jgi:hypothetical protein
VLNSTRRSIAHCCSRRLPWRTSAARRCTGTIEVGAGEREWRFIPARPSASGRCRVHVAPELEDPEGNSLERVFDAELSSGGPLYQRRPCARVSSSSDLGVRRLLIRSHLSSVGRVALSHHGCDRRGNVVRQQRRRF